MIFLFAGTLADVDKDAGERQVRAVRDSHGQVNLPNCCTMHISTIRAVCRPSLQVHIFGPGMQKQPFVRFYIRAKRPQGTKLKGVRFALKLIAVPNYSPSKTEWPFGE